MCYRANRIHGLLQTQKKKNAYRNWWLFADDRSQRMKIEELTNEILQGRNNRLRVKRSKIGEFMAEVAERVFRVTEIK